jgi:RNA polymerase sigma-70 factor (ECF subfamily)
MNNVDQKDIFIKYISENSGIIHKICNIYCNSLEDKEDMMQEITLQLWKSFPKYKGESSFSTWLYRVALNTAITNIRKSKLNPIQEIISDKVLEIPDKEDIPSLNQDINELYRAIAQLNDIEKSIIFLYLEKKSYREIGNILGISEKNVSVKIVRTKKKLHELLT